MPLPLPSSPRRAQRGFALLLVVWMLVILALVAHVVAGNGRTRSHMAQNDVLEARLEAAADGALWDAVWHAGLVDGPTWLPGNERHDLAIGGIATRIAIEDELAKIDLNQAPAALLSGLFQALGQPSDEATGLAAEIVNWRTPRTDPQKRETDNRRYRAAGAGQMPAHAAFAATDDLAGVLGMTPDLVRRSAPYVTVHGNASADPANAAPIVLTALRLAAASSPQPAPPRAVPQRPSAQGAVQRPRVLRIDAVASEAGVTLPRRAIVSLESGKPVRILEWSSVAAD